MKKIGLYLLLLILLAALIGAGVVVVSLLQKKKHKQTLQKQTQERNISAPLNAKLTKLTTIGPLYRVATILIPASKHQAVSVSVDCELEFKELHFELDAKQKQLRQKISQTLHSVPLNLLYTLDGKRAVQERIKKECNTMLVDGKIINVYLTIEGKK